MIEQALLDRLEDLVGALALTPAPKLVGVIEPATTTDLPAVVVSIEQSSRLGNGLGDRTVVITDGALAWKADVNLANPVLPGDPPFMLVSGNRLQLTLPHGGLVRSDGTTGALAAPDIQVTVKGVAQTLVQSAPAANQFTVDPLTGTLVFGAALPADGLVEAHYFLGQWEQRLVRSQGVLKLAVLATDAAAVRDLSNTVLAALGDARTPVPGLSQFAVMEIGSIGAADPPLAARRRAVRFRFEFEQEINVPESSGGVIQRISVQADVE